MPPKPKRKAVAKCATAEPKKKKGAPAKLVAAARSELNSSNPTPSISSLLGSRHDVPIVVPEDQAPAPAAPVKPEALELLGPWGYASAGSDEPVDQLQVAGGEVHYDMYGVGPENPAVLLKVGSGSGEEYWTDNDNTEVEAGTRAAQKRKRR